MLELKDLNSANARLCLKVEKTCRKLGITQGQKLLLAVSGGSDSMALALLMAFVAPRLGVEPIVLHIDHCLRSTSASEALYVRDFCKTVGLMCVIRKENIEEWARKHRCGIEEAGHHARDAIYEEMRAALGAAFVLTGHQNDDLAEDIILRLIRGTGWPGLAGMGWNRDNILRPLLHIGRAELKAFVTSCGFRWINDPSNNDLTFRRNRIRHLLMPLLTCENPSLPETLSHLHSLGDLDSDYWKTVLAEALARHPWERTETAITLPKELLQSLHPAARMRLFMHCLETLAKTGRGQGRFTTLLNLETALTEGRGKKLFQFGGITASLSQGAVQFRIGDDAA